MERKEKIYSYISSKEYIPLTYDELKIVLDVPDNDEELFSGFLDELIKEGRIFLTKKRRYALASKNLMFSGILHCNARRRFGFVDIGTGDDIFIPEKSLSTAIDGDKVLVRLEKSHNKRPEGTVVSILERANSVISAVLNDNFYAIPDNKRIFKPIRITDLDNAKVGDRVLVEITDYLKNGIIEGFVTEVLGNSKSLKSLCDAIVFSHGIKPRFSENALSEATNMPREINAEDYPERTDFTSDTVFTIDGADARDFDDAVSIKVLENGNFLLGVHIADVTEYVKAGSALDKDAAERGTSVYLTDRVIPMLPFELSNGICSLNPNVLRLTLSVIMEIDLAGNVVNHKLLKGIIRSKERMTYDDVARILEGDSELLKKYAHINNDLIIMEQLAQILYKRRENRGSINFDFPETKVILNEHGYPEKIEKVIRNSAHHMIEEFMLIANETVSEFAFWADLPFVYRVHENPDGEKIESFRRFIGNFGLFIKGHEIHPKTLQNLLDKIKDTDNELLISTYMLRSLMKAEYRPSCSGHFGLAAKYYCHFTSPIRRYPDLIIHRILKAFLDGEDISEFANRVDDISINSSETERRAELCERDTDDLFKTAYLSDFVGCEFDAKVSGVASFGLFAELENGIEGMVRLETIEDDYYEFDEEHRCLVGNRHGRTYRIGDNVKIEVVRCDIEARQIDFILPQSVKKRPPHHRRHYKKHKRGSKNG